ncbi:MAG: hypothetical protein HZA53_16630 [Planctomycetes bacterium]|nr:hypothetical protein [Planctomycetota bacterium]
MRALALAQTSTAEAPRLAWRARDERFDLGQATGVWLATDEGLQAYFDLASDPRFLLGRRIARVSFEGELARVRSAELVAALPALGRTAPEVRGDDWRFEAPADPLPRLVRGEGAWSLALFDPDGLASARFPVEADGPDGLLVRGAAAFERAVRRRGGRALHWWLEYRVGDVTLAHLGGRR